MKSKKSRKWKEHAGKILALLLITAAAWYVSTFHYQLMMIQGDSMSPSFHHLQLVVLDKHPETYNYGDVIVFHCEGLEQVLVKRVAACPGDTVLIENGVLYVNGMASRVYGPEVYFEYAGLAAEELQLGDGEYFVIGDNVRESKDSRYEQVGLVDKGEIFGKVVDR